MAERGHGRTGGPALLLRPPPVPLRRPLVLRRRPQRGGRVRSRAAPLAARPAPLATPPRHELGFGCGGPSAAVKVGPAASRGGAEQLGLCPPTLWDLAADRIGARAAATSIALPTVACVNAGSSPRRRHAACSALLAALAPPPSLLPPFRRHDGRTSAMRRAGGGERGRWRARSATDPGSGTLSPSLPLSSFGWHGEQVGPAPCWLVPDEQRSPKIWGTSPRPQRLRTVYRPPLQLARPVYGPPGWGTEPRCG